MAEGLAAEGTRVVALCRPGSGLDIDGETMLRIETDVTNAESCASAVQAALDHFGSIDALVNNAALSHAEFPQMHETPIADIEPDQWRPVLDTNVNGAFLMTRAALPPMLARRRGRIVNVSTSKGSMLAAGFLPYGPSKAALAAMTVGWARALSSHGITVNELLPGGPAGPPAPDKHWWAPDAQAWPAAIMLSPLRWLLSADADGVTERRVIARLWDESLPVHEAAARASFPAGWEIGPHDVAAAPPE
jgi:3-oxoacyl-[acyl-carrier protein] reductase